MALKKQTIGGGLSALPYKMVAGRAMVLPERSKILSVTGMAEAEQKLPTPAETSGAVPCEWRCEQWRRMRPHHVATLIVPSRFVHHDW